MRVVLANGKAVEVSQDEMEEFITQLVLPNAYWLYTGQVSEEEVMRFLGGESSVDELKKIARYLLTFAENTAFSAYLFDKADGEPDRTREFNMPALKKLRELHQKVIDSPQASTDLSQTVWEMENVCMGIGLDGL